MKTFCCVCPWCQLVAFFTLPVELVWAVSLLPDAADLAMRVDLPIILERPHGMLE